MLARDVPSGRPDHAPLLAAGVVLNDRMLDALERHGVHAVYVHDALGADIEVPQALSDEIRQQALVALDRVFSQVPQEPEPDERGVSGTSVDDLTRITSAIADELARCGDAVYALQDLAAADSYTLQHSLDVTAVGLLIGRRFLREHGWIDYAGNRRFDKIDARLTQLGVGLMLHDVGKLVVPTPILNKQGPLDDEELELIRRHPLTGLDLLPSATISPLSRTVIRSHHERWDGSGYPDGRAGADVHLFARIAAVADVYDAVTSQRPYRDAEEPHVGWRTIADGAGTLFDPTVVDTFRKVVAPYPPGAEIVLGGGRRGVVVSVSPTDLRSLRVRVGLSENGETLEPYEVDLRLAA